MEVLKTSNIRTYSYGTFFPPVLHFKNLRYLILSYHEINEEAIIGALDLSVVFCNERLPNHELVMTLEIGP